MDYGEGSCVTKKGPQKKKAHRQGESFHGFRRSDREGRKKLNCFVAKKDVNVKHDPSRASPKPPRLQILPREREGWDGTGGFQSDNSKKPGRRCRRNEKGPKKKRSVKSTSQKFWARFT